VGLSIGAIWAGAVEGFLPGNASLMGKPAIQASKKVMAR
jgi:hypothetical protein